jgi:excisionase family DNA binding protein
MNSSEEKDEMVRASVVAAMLDVPIGTVHQLVHQKRIPHVRLGRRFIRFRRSEIEAWITGQAVPPATQLGKGGR